ncbi:MAG: methyltransferase domain-containing protein [Hahellaceae bacterium]|nr:methyltransferase domain-containing protein [Hahellaceae bacterium]
MTTTKVSTERLCHWFLTPLGQALLQRQRRALEQSIARCFGYHQVEFLVDSQLPVGESSLLGHRIPAVSRWQPGLPESTLVCDPHEIPLGSDAVDMVILHHTLDLVDQPHQMLREASRIVRSGGYVVIVGFNPFSLWGLKRLFTRSNHRQEPWNLRFLSKARLDDWLTLLDFRVNATRMTTAAAPPLTSLPWYHRMWFIERLAERLKLPFGSFYVIVAQKRVGCQTPVRREWKRPRFAGVATVHPFTPYKKHEENS